MKPSVKTLGEILYAPSQYVIPVFQRNYRWELPQWQKFWTNLIEIQNPEKRGNHFMGFLVFVPGLPQPGQHTSFHLIDGQQRLTTSSILMTAVRNVARQMQQNELADEIHQDYLVHPRKTAEQHFRVLPKARDQDNYIAIVKDSGEPTGRIAEALAYFEEQLTALASESPEQLRQTFNVMCQRFEFMCATLEAENAYNIFKSLNSTGVALGSADLIRNFVFMHVLPDEHDIFDRELWAQLENRFVKSDGTLDEEHFSKFFRDYLMSSGRYVAPRETFSTFESRFEATEFCPKKLAAELITCSHHYAVIGGRQPDKNDGVTKALAGLNKLESSTTYPLLLSLFQKRAIGNLNNEELELSINMLRGFILRRFICSESSRGYGQIFVRALSGDEGDTVKALETYLLERGWPDDQQFETAFVTFPLYLRGYVRQVLETLERARGHKEPAELGDAQVEHVLPQTLSEPWKKLLGSEAERIHSESLHRIGNLTLSAYNQELWNHPFDIKRERYEQSNIVLTREISQSNSWGEQAIAERGRKLAKEATNIWIGPQKPYSQPVVQDEQNALGRRELRLEFWNRLNDYLSAEFPEIPHLEAKPSWNIRIASGVRHIGFDLRLGLRHSNVGIDVWFWRAASRPVWEIIRSDTASYDSAMQDTWHFESIEGREKVRMYIDRAALELRNESTWPDLHRWFGEVLERLYREVVPKLRADMDALSSEDKEGNRKVS